MELYFSQIEGRGQVIGRQINSDDEPNVSSPALAWGAPEVALEPR
jgi:hypothetical protein